MLYYVPTQIGMVQINILDSRNLTEACQPSTHNIISSRIVGPPTETESHRNSHFPFLSLAYLFDGGCGGQNPQLFYDRISPTLPFSLPLSGYCSLFSLSFLCSSFFLLSSFVPRNPCLYSSPSPSLSNRSPILPRSF